MIGFEYHYPNDKEVFTLVEISGNGFAYRFKRENGNDWCVTDNVFRDMILFTTQLKLF